ncbi:putative rRNA methyltransferase YqxC [Methylacidimicrobium sp. AP8]|uniref:TlyA family RNA methyltransferase n=1 Tax=Methylacidimicrobium sp. AP8 TaxID=2730359 RepID=UPI0018BFEA81|nr:TlyA family RNA methyltransferase [Methylacidimicrobium sp. AP8]CAB4244250.1 putative rRNA methyltransferase YqxC [Methylacidimicrobium sp. AP8]
MRAEGKKSGAEDKQEAGAARGRQDGAGRKLRLDLALVERGLCESRDAAQRAILAGRVRIGEARADKPSRRVGPEALLRLEPLDRYVGRGGRKLEAGLRHFALDPAGWTCLDVGASTGGFTDCLLQHGARRVIALDVGHGQLHWKLRADPRVVVRERINARFLRPEDLGENVDLATVDVSFISLRLVLPALFPLLRPEGWILALIKPQFEAGRADVGKGGIVRDPEVRDRVVAGLRGWLRGFPGLEDRGAIPSPVLGGSGNQEFLWALRRKAAETPA